MDHPFRLGCPDCVTFVFAGGGGEEEEEEEEPFAWSPSLCLWLWRRKRRIGHFALVARFSFLAAVVRRG